MCLWYKRLPTTNTNTPVPIAPTVRLGFAWSSGFTMREKVEDLFNQSYLSGWLIFAKRSIILRNASQISRSIPCFRNQSVAQTQEQNWPVRALRRTNLVTTPKKSLSAQQPPSFKTLHYPTDGASRLRSSSGHWLGLTTIRAGNILHSRISPSKAEPLIRQWAGCKTAPGFHPDDLEMNCSRLFLIHCACTSILWQRCKNTLQ